MKVLGNILWIILGGLGLALSWAIAGIICCITIIGIPLGKQCFKIASLALTPFGRHVVCDKIGITSCLGNVLWMLVFGIALFLESILLGAALCVTIVGNPSACSILSWPSWLSGLLAPRLYRTGF